jgi:gamma-glutamylcyclotransferase (GGCT)/AIG2-like uncharacterized protein YtfP
VRLFFYGSLRPGQDNYERFRRDWPGGITHVATGRIAGWALADIGTVCSIVPAATDSFVIGDVLDVSDEVFQEIEKMEAGFDYVRQPVDVTTAKGAIRADAYLFARQDEIMDCPRIAGGDWTQRSVG